MIPNNWLLELSKMNHQSVSQALSGTAAVAYRAIQGHLSKSELQRQPATLSSSKESLSTIVPEQYQFMSYKG